MAGPLRIRGLDLAMYQFTGGLELHASSDDPRGGWYLVGAERDGWALQKQRFGFSYVAIC